MLPEYYTKEQIQDNFNKLCKNYLSILLENKQKIERGVVTTNSPVEICIYDLNLQTLLLNISDKELRNYMLSAFTKYPIEHYVSQSSFEKGILTGFTFPIQDTIFTSFVSEMIRETNDMLLLLSFCSVLDEPNFLKLPTLTHKNIDKFKNDLWTIFIKTSDNLSEALR